MLPLFIVKCVFWHSEQSLNAGEKHLFSENRMIVKCTRLYRGILLFWGLRTFPAHQSIGNSADFPAGKPPNVPFFPTLVLPEMPEQRGLDLSHPSSLVFTLSLGPQSFAVPQSSKSWGGTGKFTAWD